MQSTLPFRGIALDERTDTLETLVDPVPTFIERVPASPDEKDGYEKKLELGLKQLGKIDSYQPALIQKLHWPTVVACVVIVAITQGWGFIFGVFQPWFKQHLLEAGMSESIVCLLPATQAMAMMLTCGVSGRFADRYGHKPFIALGCIVFVASTVGCAFGHRFRHMFVTQFLQGVGSGLVYPPCLTVAVGSMTSRRQLVNSIMMVGVPSYAAFAALVSRAILTQAGHRATLLAFTAIHASLAFPSLVIVFKAYNPKRNNAIVWIEHEVITDRRFWCLALSIAAATFAMLPPFVFVSVYTVDSIPLVSPQLSVVPLALINVSSAVSRAVTAVAVDHFGPHKIFVVVLFFAALSELIWAFAGTSYIRIVAFACVNGAFGTTFLAILPCLTGHLFPKADKASLAGNLIIFGAPGSLLGPWIFDKILHATSMTWSRSALYSLSFQLAAAFFACFAR